MTRRELLVWAAGVLTVTRGPDPARAQEMAPLDFSMLARRRTAEAARRLAADGWRIRDQTLIHHLEPRQSLTCPVYLIGGVEYLFVAAARPIECRTQVRLLGADGSELAPTLPDEGTRLHAIWHHPPVSCRAFLEYAVPWQASAGEVAALYVYR